MNYLAHCYLSGDNNEELLIGNFIADHVKGSAFLQYSEGIQQGIKLHRAIDNFTDSHPVVQQSKERLRPAFRKYAAVVCDVYYDHFLAGNWNSYHHLPLNIYTQNIYKLLNRNIHLIPEKAKYMLGYMEKQDWLSNYASFEGLHKALSGMAKRTPFESGMEKGAAFLEEYYPEFNKEFTLFFEDLKKEVAGF